MGFGDGTCKQLIDIGDDNEADLTISRLTQSADAAADGRPIPRPKPIDPQPRVPGERTNRRR